LGVIADVVEPPDNDDQIDAGQGIQGRGIPSDNELLESHRAVTFWRDLERLADPESRTQLHARGAWQNSPGVPSQREEDGLLAVAGRVA